MTTVFHPMQYPWTNRPQYVPESVALAAYEVYVTVWGEQAAIIDVATGCRGGFSVNEIIAYLYARPFPRDQWRQRFEEAIERPTAGVDAARSQP